jgi:serine/threonine protein kinase
VRDQSLEDGAPAPNLLEYHGAFAHLAFDPAGWPRIYPCIQLGLYGDSLSALMRHCQREYGAGIPIDVVRQIMRGVFTGLAYLHKCGILHTDIKPGNILMTRRIGEISDGFDVVIADLGSSTFEDELFSERPGTTNYLAPELIIGMPYTSAIDIWSAFTMVYQLITGDYLFDVYNDCDVTYGDDIEFSDSGACDMCDVEHGDECDAECGVGCGAECGTECGSRAASRRADDSRHACTSHTSEDSDSSGSEDSEEEARANYRLILLMAKVLGFPPPEYQRVAYEYYSRTGIPKHDPGMTPITLGELLLMNIEIDPEEALEIELFLLNGLKYMPEQRVSASDALALPWLA